MNVTDIVILIALALGAIGGFKSGVIKKTANFVGIFIIIILSFYLKNYLSVIMYENLPFINFGGFIKGIEAINILFYEVLAFVIVYSLLYLVFKVVLMLTGLIEKILKATVILSIPSKILGIFVGIIEMYVYVFLILVVITLPIINIPYVRDSKIANFMLDKTPILSKVSEEMVDTYDGVYKIVKEKDNKNNEELVSREKADKYLPVDMYIGGVEHAVLHLLYSRFYTKFLCDIGVIDFDEPFHKLFNQGMITGKNGIKMSKSKGNVVSPDDLVRDYGCDSLRMYELFVGPPELDAEWDESGIDGVHRFLTRFYKLIMDQKDKGVEADKELLKVRHKLIYDITTRLNNFSLNTVVSGFMEYTNTLTAMAKKSGVDKETLETAIVLLAPFAPHIAEELWEAMGHEDSVFAQTWPTYDEEAMKEDEVEIVVQINGKVKGKLVIGAEEDKDSVLAKAKEVLGDKLNGNIVKEIYVPGRIVNIVQK